MTTLPGAALNTLDPHTGRRPADDDSARAFWHARFDRCRAILVQGADTDDVVVAVAFVGEQQIDLGVRGAWVNFMTADAGNRVAAPYDPVHQPPGRLKQRYAPDNQFILSQNIRRQA